MRKISAHGLKLKREPRRHHPLVIAGVRANIRNEINSLSATAGLQALIGEGHAMVANKVGRLCFIVCHAAAGCGLDQAPEVSILRGLAESLGDIVASPQSLERLRGSIQSGVLAANRLIPRLDEFSLAIGSLELDALLAKGKGMGTSDIDRLLTGRRH